MHLDLSKIARLLGVTIAGLFLLTAIAYALLLFINRHDSAPSTDFLALDQAPGQPAPDDADNGYVFAMGFSAPATADVLVEGRKNIGKLNAWLEKGEDGLYDNKGPGSVMAVLQAQPGTASDILTACSLPGADCLPKQLTDPASISRLIHEHPWILERYRVLISRPQWREASPANPVSLFSLYPDSLEAQKILLLQARINAQAGNAKAAGQAVEMDHVFWRNVLANTNSLSTKMAAAASLRRNYVLGSLALMAAPGKPEPASLPPSWKQEITAADRSFLRIFRGEVRASADLLKQSELNGALVLDAGGHKSIMRGWLEKLLLPLLKRQDTLNFYARKLMANELRFSIPLQEYPGLVMSLRKQKEDWPWSLYNPVGRLLIATGIEPYADYYPRISDLEGVRRLALLATTLHMQHVAPDAVAAAVASSTLRNPYNGAAFEWDGKASLLKFQGLQTNADKAGFNIPYQP
ncbi:MAG TPA: hypothetical protein VF050_06730 [Moraxellaceae bacterium]